MYLFTQSFPVNARWQLKSYLRREHLDMIMYNLVLLTNTIIKQNGFVLGRAACSALQTQEQA